jgi:hypothetical protein
METRRGIARKVRFSTQVTGTSDKDGGTVSTSYVAVFEIEGVAVHAGATRPPTIEEADEVVVAGEMHDGVFDAHALRNITRGTVDHKAWVSTLCIGIVILVVGLGWTLMFLASRSDQPVAVFGLPFVAGGGWALRSSNRVRLAEAAVRAAR